MIVTNTLKKTIVFKELSKLANEQTVYKKKINYPSNLNEIIICVKKQTLKKKILSAPTKEMRESLFD